MALTESQKDRVELEFQKRYAKNRRLQEERKTEIREKVPEHERLRKEQLALFMERFRARHDKARVSEIDNITEKLDRDMGECLIRAGYPADYLENVYDCPICKDKGWVGKKKCACRKALEVRVLFDDNPDRKTFEANSFDNFRLDVYDDTVEEGETVSPRRHMVQIRESIDEMLEKFTPGKDNILFIGDTGTGKTFLACCIAGELMKKGYNVIRITASELMDLLVERGRSPDGENRKRYRTLMECDIVVIDDLGTETINTMTNALLFAFIEGRSSHSNIITTNLGMNRLMSLYSERIVSRFSNYLIHILYNHDKDIRSLLREEKREKREDDENEQHQGA